MTRLSEVAMRLSVLFLLNPRPSDELWMLSDLRSRSSEKSLPKRDEVVQPLFHAGSGEVGWIKRG
ncbi:hypothetical protein DEO72_LG2g2811 [Vigna unguiculata]|uniref:Uncharacterized protein n=1 Tax=Vigna unguiculata TaxID=3917 RepID=A0A4D6L1V3_VIGUN|nr:hypothetical protein DEO72_LG2g2811 [Vigna unguiculata]